MPQLLDLEQLKSEAKKQNRRVIRGNGEAGWRPLDYWNGFSRGTNQYYLFGDMVLAMALFGTNEWYTLK